MTQGLARMGKAAAMALWGLCAIVPLSSQPESRTDWEADGLKGRVRSYVVESVSLVQKFGAWSEASRYLSESRSYDPRGRCLEAYENPDGGLPKKTNNVYDSKGNRIESLRRNADDSLDIRLVYTYDAAGNNTEEVAYDPRGPLMWKTVNTFDGNANLTEAARYASSGSLIWKSVYTHHDSENETDVARYNAAGALMWKSVSTHDGMGREVESARYFADGSLMGRSVHAYDGAGNRIESDEYGADGSLTGVIGWAYEYDKAGNWVKKTEQEKVNKFGKTSWEPTGQMWSRSIEYYD